MRNNLILVAFAAAAVTAVAVIAADLKSGLEVGQSAGAFNVKDCTGPAQGKAPLCYR